jgi:hypothetical protein
MRIRIQLFTLTRTRIRIQLLKIMWIHAEPKVRIRNPGNNCSRQCCRPDETGLCDQCGGLLPSGHLPLPHLHTLSPLQKGDILFSERSNVFILFLIKFTCLSSSHFSSAKKHFVLMISFRCIAFYRIEWN